MHVVVVRHQSFFFVGQIFRVVRFADKYTLPFGLAAIVHASAEIDSNPGCPWTSFVDPGEQFGGQLAKEVEIYGVERTQRRDLVSDRGSGGYLSS